VTRAGDAVFRLPASHRTELVVPRIVYTEFDGTAHAVEVQLGYSVMQGAVENCIPGIDGDCGGRSACATCHIFVDAAWQAKTGGRSPIEEEMLAFAPTLQPGSRLACQIRVTADLDGLIVTMPERQH
jgi:2Fe-2S ferredoxin